MQILVVDDDRINLKLMLTILRKLGYTAISASDGAEAVEAYRQHKPDCVLMDLQMPEMDGIEATHHIRRIEMTEDLRPAFISALTANITAETRHVSLDAGMSTYLNKPIQLDRLAQMLEQAYVRTLHSADGINAPA